MIMNSVLTPEQVRDRYPPIRSQLGGFCEANFDVAMRDIPSDVYTDNEQWYRGFIFKMGDITCGISAESLRKAGFSGMNIPALAETFRRFEERQVPLKVIGTYRTHNQNFDVDYARSFPYILDALDHLK
jgi:hypothetical protein